MTFYYRNRETGLVQPHPTSGLGESLNSDEIGKDGKPVKPYIPLGASPEVIAERVKLLKGNPTDSEATPGTRSTENQNGA